MNFLEQLEHLSSSSHLAIVLILTVGFSLASLFGYLSDRLKISPILGYLIAGYFIGPFFPGFNANVQASEQLAEVGIILMMFGVGLHFKWQDLIAVRNIVLPGAFSQSIITTLGTAFFVHLIGGSWTYGIITGLALAVSSTVVLARVLSDENLLNTPQGNIAVAWTVVEDLITVFILVLIPAIAFSSSLEVFSWYSLIPAIFFIFLKFFALLALMFTLGSRCVNYVLFLVARTHSHELFTLTILALTFVIAIGSSFLFGTSIALGAFIAGLIVGQTVVKHQALAYSSPMKDAFLVIFFLSVGMIFNPFAIQSNFPLFLIVLGVILLFKPIVTLLLILFFKYPFKTAFVVALAIAQIGEFSFILIEEALKYKLVSDDVYDVIVACALISICLNPLLFRLFKKQWNGEEKIESIDPELYKNTQEEIPVVVLIGLGAFGRKIVDHLLHEKWQPIIIDRDVDLIAEFNEQNLEAFYGDASIPRILEVGYLDAAKLLIINCLEKEVVLDVIKFARESYPLLPIIVRVKSIEEKEFLKDYELNALYCDEEEGFKAFFNFLTVDLSKQIL